MRFRGGPALVTLLMSVILLGGCLRAPTAPNARAPSPTGAILGLLDVEVRFDSAPPQPALVNRVAQATSAYVGPTRGANLALLTAATPVIARTDFALVSATRVASDDLHYITLVVEVTNRTGATLQNLSILGYSSKNVAYSGSAVTAYAGTGGQDSTSAGRVTPFLGAASGDPRTLGEGVTIGTTLFGESDPAFVSLATLLTAAPYDAVVAEVFPYGFVANPQGNRTIANDATGTFHLSFRVLPNTTLLSWRGVIVQDPIMRLGLPAEVVGADNHREYLRRLTTLSVSNSDASVRGVMLGNVDDVPSQRVVEVRHNTFHVPGEAIRNLFAAGRLRVDAISDVKLRQGTANGDHWLEAPTATPTTMYLLERFTAVGDHTFDAPVTGDGLVEVEYLVVAGGGGGGSRQHGGGGGAGGYRSNVAGESSGGGASAEPALALAAQTYPVTVGAGGGGGIGFPGGLSGNNSGSRGSDSLFASITAVGGGEGAKYNVAGGAGGSGGGGGGEGGAGGLGSTAQGRDGNSGSPSVNAGGGGGGGAAQPGAASTGPYAASIGGKGGDGLASSMTGTAVFRAGGGGGGGTSGGATSLLFGAGGIGGGGAGDGASGISSTGSGGGANSSSNTGNGGAGGSGIVIVRYPLSP